MADKDPEDTSIEVSATEQGLPNVKVSGITKALKWFMPERYQKNLAAEALIAKLGAVGTLTDDERAMAAWAINNQALKLDNVADVGGYILECERQLEEAKPSLALPPIVEAPAADIVSEQTTQFFWDRFWADAENASVDYVQRLLGEIGARKRNDAKAFSLRTLDVIRCLDPETIDGFHRLCAYVLDRHALPVSSNFHDYQFAGISHYRLLVMQEAGLLTFDQTALLLHDIRIGAGTIRQARQRPGEGPPPAIRFPVITLTTAGRELMQLRPVAPNDDQVKALRQYIARTCGHPTEWRSHDVEEYQPLGHERLRYELR